MSFKKGVSSKIIWNFLKRTNIVVQFWVKYYRIPVINNTADKKCIARLANSSRRREANTYRVRNFLLPSSGSYRGIYKNCENYPLPYPKQFPCLQSPHIFCLCQGPVKVYRRCSLVWWVWEKSQLIVKIRRKKIVYKIKILSQGVVMAKRFWKRTREW